MRSRPDAAVLAAAAFLCATPAAAQTGWGMIGQASAAAAESQASATATGTDPVHELMLCVEDAPMRFRSLTVRYQDGTSQSIGLRDRILAGRCGREIALRGRRVIAGVDVGYDPAAMAGANAKVQVYGR